MRRFLLIAAAAMITLIGLSANQCSGGKEETAAPAKTEEMPAKPDDSMSGDQGSMSDQDSTSGEGTVDQIPADE